MSKIDKLQLQKYSNFLGDLRYNFGNETNNQLYFYAIVDGLERCPDKVGMKATFSHSQRRYFWRGGRVVEGNGLLNRHTL